MVLSEQIDSHEKPIFEQEDLKIFKIPDPRTRLDTIQNYFFPRLEVLLRQSLELVQEIYGVNAYERMTVLYTPSHRKDARATKEDRPYVRVGIGGKRNHDRPLTIKRKDGEAYKLHNARLYYLIEPSGEILVYLWMVGQIDAELNSEYLARLRDSLTAYFEILNSIFTLNHISHADAKYFLNFPATVSEEFAQGLIEDSLQFFSPSYYLPVSFERGLFHLQMAFAALYPLLEFSMDCEEGQPDRLPNRLNAYMDWYRDGGAGRWYERHMDAPEVDEGTEEIQLPELDSYRFIRAGLWWDILARDNWTCCSCRRSVKEHGVTLHVDHIVPRSKGGTDDRKNLQTLCLKCNIGKSNRDSTDLSRSAR